MDKKILLLISSLFLIASIKGYSQSNIENIVKKYVESFNSGNIIGFDTILTENCKSFNKKVVSNKQNMIDVVRNLSKNENIEVIEIKSENKIVQTKEYFTDDITNYLNLKPIVRKREYHFTKKNKIKSVYNINVDFPEDFKEKQEKFLEWAKQNYSELYQDMTHKYSMGKNISEERRYLLSLLREDGLDKLDNIKINEDVTDDEKFPHEIIFFDDFRMEALLKTKDEISKLFGEACDKKRISETDYWFYGSKKCKEKYKGPKIIYKHNGKEVHQVQIQFNSLNIAVGVNAL